MSKMNDDMSYVRAHSDNRLSKRMNDSMNKFNDFPNKLNKSLSVSNMDDICGTKESLMVFRSLIRQYQGMSTMYGNTNFGEKLVGSKLHYGGVFVKHHVRSGVAMRVVWCSEDLKVILWGSLNKRNERVASGHVLTQSVIGVYAGFSCPTSIPFKRSENMANESRCFTIQTSERTLDLECLSPHERDLWIVAFRHLVKTFGRGGGELQRVASASQGVTNDPAALESTSDSHSDNAQSDDNSDSSADAHNDIMRGIEMDPNMMSREMLIDEVMLLRNAAKSSVPKSEIDSFRQSIAEQQLEWMNELKTREDKVMKENEQMKTRIEILLNQKGGAGGSGGAGDYTSMKNADHTVSAKIADAKQFFGPSMSKHEKRKQPLRITAGASDEQLLKVTNRLANVERLLTQTEDRLNVERRKRGAVMQKLEGVQIELDETKRLVAFVIGSLSAPGCGNGDMDTVRTEEEFEADKLHAAGYLERHAKTLDEKHVLNKRSIEDIVASLNDDDLVVKLDRTPSTRTLQQIEEEPVASGGDSVHAYDPALSIAASTTVTCQSVGVVDTADMSQQLVLAQTDHRNDDVVIYEDIVVGDNDHDDRESRHRDRMVNLFHALKAQWSLAVRLESNADVGMPKWIPDRDAPECLLCDRKFTLITRRHHCRMCGGVYCGTCAAHFVDLEKYMLKDVRVCSTCFSINRAMCNTVTRPIIQFLDD